MYVLQTLPQSILDTIFKDIIEINQSIIISENVEFVEPTEALTLLQRKITDMKQEEISKVRKASEVAKGAFVDPIEGTQLAIDKAQAQDFLNDLQDRNQNDIMSIYNHDNSGKLRRTKENHRINKYYSA